MGFAEVIEELSRKGFSVTDTTRDLIDTIFISFHNRVNTLLGERDKYEELEKEYLRVIEPYKKRGVLDLFVSAFAGLIKDMEENPYEDILGEYYLEQKAKIDRQYRGQFFTPPNVADCMVEITFSLKEIEEKGVITACEPAAGAGIFPLRAAKWLVQNKLSVRSVRWTLWEIDPVFFKIAYINTTLWGIPAVVIHGDSLKGEALGVYPNLHFLVHPVLLEGGVAQLDRARGLSPEVGGSSPPSPTGRTAPFMEEGKLSSSSPLKQLRLF